MATMIDKNGATHALLTNPDLSRYTQFLYPLVRSVSAGGYDVEPWDWSGWCWDPPMDADLASRFTRAERQLLRDARTRTYGTVQMTGVAIPNTPTVYGTFWAGKTPPAAFKSWIPDADIEAYIPTYGAIVAFDETAGPVMYNTSAWTPSTYYSRNVAVTNSSKVYLCEIAGTSGSSGPTGTGSVIVDGTVTWSFYVAI